MPKDTAKKETAKNVPGTNPNLHSQQGAINPSAPTTGTEAWGNTSDERRVLSQSDPSATRSGQMKGNPGDSQTSASQRASGAARSNAGGGDNPADLSRRTSASAHSMNTSKGGTAHTFRCSDMGNADCRWETSGRTEEEVMQRVEEHGRRNHGLKDWSEGMRNRVRDAIHRRAA
ncbi:MAG TPA: DUF1059 domain-containing protein [Candidatus Binatia bacterium]|nr:DUF1059 domain-containing protein [Candidatus Binatia bacterium]